MKRCPSCQRELDVSCFGKNVSKKDGLQNYCKDCRKAQAQSRTTEISEYQAKYRKKNAFRLSEYAKAKYRANPERYKAKARAWREANADRKRTLDKEWQRRNRNRVNLNCARRRARKKAATTIAYSVDDLLAKLIVWKHRCYLCGDLLDSTIHWDHVKPLAAGGPNILANIRPTHGKCNMSKGGKWPLER